MKELREDASECKIPTYIEDILIHNYCPNFLRMTMVREGSDYTFNYQTERYKKIDIGSLDTYDKLVLLRTVIAMRDGNEDWLIQDENYVLDPELIYTINNSVQEGSIRMLYYPDYKRMSFKKKMLEFVEKIRNSRNKIENDLLDKFKSVCELNDWNRTRLFLDKNILRMQKM